jgi:predicted aspartyl protease
MGLGKVIGLGIALGLVALILVAGIIGAVKHASEVTAGTGLAVLILLGALSYIAEKFNKALKEYRALRATKPGKPLQ